MTEKIDVVIIGGGPAGLMAAVSALDKGASVMVLEKTAAFGTKLLITGKGRCNITNTITETKAFLEHFGKKGKFLYPALNQFGTLETLDFFHSKGLKTIIEKEFKYFPASNNAKDVLNIFIHHIKQKGGKLISNANIKSIVTANGCIEKIRLIDKEVIAKSYILATGGRSYPQTGSTGDGYDYAATLGHTIVPPRAALTPVMVKEPWVSNLQGLTLIDAKFLVKDGEKCLAEEINDAVFTSNGLSGPAIYNLSRKLTSTVNHKQLQIDLFPSLSVKELDQQFLHHMTLGSRKIIKNIVSEFVPPTLLPLIFSLTDVNPDMNASILPKEQREKITTLLKSITLTIQQFYGFEKAVITSGGIDLKEIDGKSMRSKRIDNLYFAGELIDLDGPTGGFNLQLCWTTGYIAGISAATLI